jgi:hypothetical protein
MMMAMEFLSCLTRKTAAASFTLYKLGFWLSCCCKWWNSLHKNMHIHIVHVIYREMHHELLKTFVIGIREGSAFRCLRDSRLLSWGWWAEWIGWNSQKGPKADHSPVYRNQRDFWETFWKQDAYEICKVLLKSELALSKIRPETSLHSVTRTIPRPP